MNPVEMFGVGLEWLRGLGMSQVSRFIFLCCFVIQTLDLELYRSDFDSAVVTPGSVDLPATFRVVFGWLHYAGAFQVSCFDFLRLADIYSFNLESSASTSTFNGSIWTFCGLHGWPRRPR